MGAGGCVWEPRRYSFPKRHSQRLTGQKSICLFTVQIRYNGGEIQPPIHLKAAVPSTTAHLQTAVVFSTETEVFTDKPLFCVLFFPSVIQLAAEKDKKPRTDQDRQTGCCPLFLVQQACFYCDYVMGIQRCFHSGSVFEQICSPKSKHKQKHIFWQDKVSCFLCL